MMKKDDQIVIIGVTGYMGSWLAKSLSDDGYTNITGTFRNQAKMNYLKQVLPKINGIKANLIASPDQITVALNGAKWVFNDSASFEGHEQTVDDYVKTKVQAVDNLFDAIKANKTVNKLLQIGSSAAISMGNTDEQKKVFTEDDWADLDSLDYPYEPFISMKVMEEKRVWQLTKETGISATVLHPTNVVGPSFTPWQHDMIYAYLHEGTYLADGPMDSVDVRDLAQEEIALMNNEAASGKRVLGLGFTTSYNELVQVVKSELAKEQVKRLFGHLPEIIPAAAALALWRPIAYTSFYKDRALPLINGSVVKTKYPEFYEYQYRDVNVTVKAALHKMLKDLD